MPAASLSIVQSASGQPKSIARVIAVIGRCSAVSTPAVYAFDTDTTVPDELGNGPLVEATMALVREGGQRVLAIPCATGVAGSLTAVTETPAGTGPAITVAGTPYDSLDIVVRVVRGGVIGTSKFRVSLDDGLTFGPTLTTAASYLIPKTGITITFGVGTYVINTDYTFSSTAPAPTTAEVASAINVLLAGTQQASLILLAQTDTTTVTETLAMANQLDTSMESARLAKQYVRAMLSPNVDAADADIATSFGPGAAIDAERVVLVPGDAYISGGNLAGSMRRPAAWAAAIKSARNRLSSDLGNGADGPLPFVNDITRDEFTSTVKLREDGRATVLETRPGSDGFFFARGVTLASAGSIFSDLNIARVIDEACRVAQPLLNQEVNNDPLLKANGTISDDDAERIEAKLYDALELALLKPADGVAHASSVEVLVDRSNVIATTEDLRVTISVQKKGQNKTVTATVGITSTASSQPLAA